MKKVHILYDSAYGNTASVARTLASAFHEAEVRVSLVGEVSAFELASPEGVLIVGSPTQGGRATQRMQEFFKTIPRDGLNGTRIAVFDTRMAEEDQGRMLRLLMKTIGYAAPHIAQILEGKGACLIAPPEGFIVLGKEGPLKDGELARATAWAQQLDQNI
jgi:flavodoxin